MKRDKLTVAYYSWRTRQKQMRIPIDLILTEFREWWENTGHLDCRGHDYDQYCMSRIDHTLPYSTDNIECITNKDATRKISIRRGRKVFTPLGNFLTLEDAAKAHNIRRLTVRARCQRLQGWGFL